MTVEDFISRWNDASPTVEVHTSGSTGEPKVLHVEKQRMLASARATCDFLGLKPGDSALLCMSVDYIAGKMMVVRSIERRLQLLTVPPSSHPLESRELYDEKARKLDFAAMVPLQIYESLKVPVERERLGQIRHIIIGGGPLDADLEQELRHFGNVIWHSYGMTETLSHIALRRVSGKDASPWFTPLPGISLAVNDDNCLVIDAPHLCAQVLTTHDVVELEQDTQRFKVLGRIDNVINTGGVKIQIEQVEQALSPHLSRPFIITKCPDSKFGEIVVMLIQGTASDVVEAKAVCLRHLSKYACPKRIFAVESLPMTGTHKPARSQASSLAASLCSHNQ